MFIAFLPTNGSVSYVPYCGQIRRMEKLCVSFLPAAFRWKKTGWGSSSIRFFSFVLYAGAACCVNCPRGFCRQILNKVFMAPFLDGKIKLYYTYMWMNFVERMRWEIALWWGFLSAAHVWFCDCTLPACRQGDTGFLRAERLWTLLWVWSWALISAQPH